VAAQIGNAVPPILGAIVGNVLPGEAVVDLFAGAGGLSYGLEMAGKKVTYAAELDRHAVETFRINHPHAIVKALDLSTSEALDQLESDVRELGGCELLVGGPPCQSFSTAGRRVADLRSTLVNSFVAAVAILRPPTVVMENVLGLRSFRNGSVLKGILRDLTKLGYHVDVWDITTDRYAIPQRRRRLLVVGSLKGVLCQPPAITPTYKNGAEAPVSVRDAISDLPPLEADDGTTPAEVDLPEARGPYQQYVRGDLAPDEYLASMALEWAPASPNQIAVG
jgi:DNA-cytosine methyltransferase